ncbi:unnamed protein product, partial [Medioppia subpectinata]
NGFKLGLKCGHSHTKPIQIGANIIGGSDVAHGEFPWQVILNYDFDGQKTDNCGATIINENWVLTAAHCVKDMPEANKYNIRLNVYNRTTRDSTELNVKAKKLIVHEHYNRTIKVNDIALIKLSETLDFNGKHKAVEPICLPNPSTKLADKCVATGIGLNEQGLQPQKLQKVNEPLRDDKVCADIYDIYNSDVDLCGGSGQKGGVCTGDSGGPLQCLATDGLWYQLGITSYGGTCGEVPDVFVKVLSFIHWIEKIVTYN